MPALWRYDQVVWGVTECATKRCSRPADGLLDFTPLCLDCAGLQFERICAVQLDPGIASMLPPLDE